MKVFFSKIHGLGNDFIVINELEKAVVKNKPDFAKKYCKPKFFVGADGVLFLQSSKKADFKMQIINSDGSEAENCVNGLRCVALEKFLLEGKKRKKFSIETLQGIVNAEIVSFSENKAVVQIEILSKPNFVERNWLEIDGRRFDYAFVNVGNPHVVIFLRENVENFPVEQIGHKIEYHPQFSPSRTNAEFVNVLNSTAVNMRVHERGACETMACGSGSIAIAVAGVHDGFLEKNSWISVKQPGGILKIFFGEKLLLQGEAEKVFAAKIES